MDLKKLIVTNVKEWSKIVSLDLWHDNHNLSWFKNSIGLHNFEGESEEPFFNYGYKKEKSTLLYSFCQERIQSIITSRYFKKQLKEISNERKATQEFSTLPSITDCKENINKWRNNIDLNPIDCSLEFLSGFSINGTQFGPDLLNFDYPEIREF